MSDQRKTLRRCVVATALLGLVSALTACQGPQDAGKASTTSSSQKLTGGGGSATVSWTPPTQDTSGGQLQDLAGYRVYYGPAPTDLPQVVSVNGATVTSAEIGGLPTGTWYFAVTAYTSSGAESAKSTVVDKTIQ